MSIENRSSLTLSALTIGFLILAGAFLVKPWGRLAPLVPIPLVDPSFTSNTTVRVSYARLVETKADLSDFDCYGCHERGKPPPLRFDTNQNLIIPSEHGNISMGHGTHNRNNLCFNCHDENNLEVFQTRDGHQLKLAESTRLCGSCHGPTLRDWEAGVHGRTSGFWNAKAGVTGREDCVSCHNPHSPKFPPRQPAPGPHPLHPASEVVEISHGTK